MKELKITYSVLKQLTSQYTLSLFYVKKPDCYCYNIFASGEDFVYHSSIYGDDEKLDFETNLMSYATETQLDDDAIALAIPIVKKSYSNNAVVAKGLYVEGKLLTLTGTDEGYVEWTFDTIVELQGGDGQVTNGGATLGDYVNFGIFHPVYGEIYRFATNIYLYGNGIYQISSDLVAPLPAGLSIRMTYKAIDSNGRNVICRLRCYK